MFSSYDGIGNQKLNAKNIEGLKWYQVASYAQHLLCILQWGQ